MGQSVVLFPSNHAIEASIVAYTIAFLLGDSEKRYKVLNALQERLVKDGRFKAEFQAGEEKLSREDKRIAAEGKIYVQLPLFGRACYVPCIRIAKVRLTQKKPYCGNHPGPCPVDSKPKPNSTHLEWDDWVKFHKLVNTVLNKFRVRANVWTLPYDVRGRMWIRRDNKPRIKWDYTEERVMGTNEVRIWNQGTPDQFVRDMSQSEIAAHMSKL